MGDAFRGLTLRIGADSRPVNSAISSITRAASAAQKQLNALNKALKFDTANTAAMAQRVDLVGDKALLAARAARKLETAMEQAGQRTKQLAKNTSTAYADVEHLRSSYNNTNAELERIYDAVIKVIKKKKELNKDDATDYFKKLRDGGREARAELRAYVADAAKMTNVNKAFGQTKGQVNELLVTYDQLVRAHRMFNVELKAAKKAEGYKAMEAQLAAYQAQLKEAAMDAARFRAEMHAASGVENLVADARRLDSTLDKAVSSAKRMSSAFDAMPKSMEAARAKAAAFRAEENALNAKLKTTQEILHKIGATKGFNRQAALTSDVWSAADRAVEKYAKVEAKLRVAQDRASALKADLMDALRANGPADENVRKLGRQLVEATNHAKKLAAELKAADNSLKGAQMAKAFREGTEECVHFEAEIARLQARTSRLNQLRSVFGTLRTMGYGLYSTITPAITMAGRYAIMAADDIDSACRDMRKTVNGTEEQFEDLQKSAIEFSRTHVTSADTILEIEAMGGQLGIAAENLDAFSEVVSNLDIATDINAEDMAKYIGQLSNIMRDIDTSDVKEYQKDITSFSDALVRLGNNSAAQESSIMKVMMRIASMGNISGMTTPQLLAVSTAIAATGQGCEAAGTAISRTFSNIEAAVSAGGEKLQAFADVAGMSADDFAKAWNEKPIEAFTAFIGGLKRIDEEGGSVDQTLASLKINSVRQKQALMNLTNTYDVLTKSLDMSQTAWDGMSYTMDDGTGKVEEAGDAAREAQRKSEGFSGALSIMKNNAKGLAAELADGAAPIITGLGETFKGFTEAVSLMPQETKTAIVAVAGIVAAAGPATVAIGALGSAFATFADIVGTMVGGHLLKKAFAEVSGLSVPALARLEETFPKLANGFRTAQSGISGFVAAAAPLAPAILAAGGAMAYLVTSISDSAAKHQAHIDVVNSLNSTLLQTKPYALNAAAGMEALNRTLELTHYNFDDVVKGNMDMIKSVQERNKAAEAEVSSLQAARAAIERYGNAGRNLTGAEQGQLIAAIDLVNEKCGTQFQILDSLTGKLGDESGAYLENVSSISEYIAQKQKLIQVSALEADLADLQSRKRDTLAAMMSSDDINEMQKGMAELRSFDSAIEATEKMLGDAAAAADGAKLSIGELITQTGDFQAYFMGKFNDMAKNGKETPWTSYQESLLAFGDALNETGLDIDAFSNLSYEQMGNLTKTWMESGGDINATLASIGLTAVSASDQMGAAFEGMGVSWADFVSQFGGNADDIVQRLSDVGISMETMTSIGGENLARAIAESEGNIDTLIAKIQELANQPAVETQVNVDDSDLAAAEEQADNTSDAIEGIPDEESTNFDDSSLADAEEQANNTTDAVKDIPENKDISVNVTGNAQSELQSIIDKLSAIQSKEITVTANYTSNGTPPREATGGINPGVIRAIPRHADGMALNGIVTSATMTNRGLVGEDGTEALVHYGGSGYVIPLSNRRYVRPFARAVASEMPSQSFDDSAIVAELQALHRDMARIKIEMDSRQVGRAVAPTVSRALAWDDQNAGRGF